MKVGEKIKLPVTVDAYHYLEPDYGVSYTICDPTGDDVFEGFEKDGADAIAHAINNFDRVKEERDEAVRLLKRLSDESCHVRLRNKERREWEVAFDEARRYVEGFLARLEEK